LSREVIEELAKGNTLAEYVLKLEDKINDLEERISKLETKPKLRRRY